MSEPSQEYALSGSEVAIVGMAGRFPGAASVREFWDNLCRGLESLALLSDDDLARAGIDPALRAHPGYVRAVPAIDDVEMFDAGFFGYTRLEAEVMDPQQRLFLEAAWQALEEAGYDPALYPHPVGVFTGAKTNTYLLNLVADRERRQRLDTLQLALGNDLACMATRVSYKLDLRGPSYALHTACSTSLVAIHLACQSLLMDECRMAVAGGAAVNVPQRKGYLYQPGGILSPDGSCRTFDARAQGSNFGNGVGAVVLKRLEEALADGDHVYAVIKGSAANNDGARKASYTAPGVEGQTAVILEALAAAGVDADTVSYVEAHGTATDLGDSIELLALTEAYRASTERVGYCGIGSVKTNVGHLETAAGIAGLIKTALALEREHLPASLHFEQPNPKIDFASSPFHVLGEAREWQRREGAPRRAGLSSFGIGSTNVHMILEEAPRREPTSPSRPWQLLLLSARSEAALETATRNLAEHFAAHPEVKLADAAFTLQAGRRLFPYRRAVVCREEEGAAGAAAALRALDPEQAFTHLEEGPGRSVAFLFPGLGDQSLRMGLGLYRSEPTFRRHVDRCCDLLAPHLGVDLREVLYPEGMEGDGEETADGPAGGLDLRRMLGRSTMPGAPEADDPAVRRLQETAFSQPAVFVFEYALARLWIEWGVKPQAMIGYSLGEYVAAALGGVFPLEKALELVAKRARLIQELPPGAMLAVPFSAEEAQMFLSPEVALAAINGPRQCVLSGTPEAIAALERRLTGEGVACRRLATTHAFHSPMMRPAYEAVVELMRGVRLQAPRVPFLSNVTGTWIRPEEATDPEYWARHMVQAVRFGDGVAELLREPDRVLLEVGPGQTLSSFVKLHPDCTDEAARFVFASLPPAFGRQPDAAYLIGTLGKLRLASAAVDWKGFYRHETRRRVPLPTYPFERQRYWLDGEETAPATALEAGLQKNPDLAEWFYKPVWQRVERPSGEQPGEPVSGLWLLLCDGHGLGEGLARQLEAAGREVVRARIGEGYRRLSIGEFEVRPGFREDFDALFGDLKQRGRKPAAIVHLWGYGDCDVNDLDGGLDRCFYSLLFLGQSLGRQGWTDPLRLEVVTSGLQAVVAGDVPRPEKATVLGPAKVIPQEYAHVACRVIDLEAPGGDEKLAGRLFAELGAAGSETAVALRGEDRWTEGYEAVRLESPEPSSLPWREGGVYLITGGLGGVGFVMAEHLARTARARLVLTRRSPLSDEATRKVRCLEELGAEVLVLAADTTDAERMRAVVAEALEKFGALHGVLHAAGLGGGGLIQLKTRAAAAAVLAPKVHGLRVVEEAVASNDVDLELLVLFSSLQTALGDFGQVDYCAANAYLDAVAQRNTALGGPRTVAVGWDNWQEVGIAVTAEVPEHMRAWREEILAKGILPSEGPEVLDRVLAAGLPRVVVTTQDLAARIEQSHSYSGDKVMQQLQGGAAAPAATRPAPVLGGAHRPGKTELERRVTAIWQRMLGRERIGVNDNFFDLGGNSLLGMQLITELNRELDAQIAPVALFEAPTVSSLVKYLNPAEEPQAKEKTERPSFFTTGSRDIAVIGMDGRFPKAKGLEEFWRNLREGVDCVTVFSDEELVAAGVDPATLREPTYVKARPVLDDVEYFDATLFGYSPREAEIIDPQHRVFLQCAWTALERAGYDPERYPGAVGVFAGAAISTYLLNLYSNPELIGAVGNFQAMIGNEKDSLATRVSYKLNLRGPSLSVQTFCSTSLVAVHLACQSLLTGESDMALAGGASIHVPQASGYHYQEGGFVSRDGRVKAFDARADGFLFGNGVGVVLLKRLEDALADGDRVLAVIKGSAINNDGSAKVGYTATSVEGQSEVIARALRNAGVEAESIGYVESHGTGTALGDPVEIAALTKAFRSPSRGTCPIGSVKTNIGHLDRAAGVSSLIKAVMVLEHGEIPPSLHFAEPNPKIDFANSPFYVNTRLTEWKTNGHPRRIGVNSLGLGGTNAHVVLEEAPAGDIEPSGPSRPRQLLVLSARSRAALDAMTDNLAAHLRRHPEENLADAAYTLQIGRKVLEHRRVLVASADGIEAAAAALEARDPKQVLTGFNEEGERPVVFLFPGLGGQYPGMAEGLYRAEPVFREEVDRCAELLRPLLGLDLREVMVLQDRQEEAGASGIDLRRMLARGNPETPEDEATRRLNRTAFSQPAMFVVEYALARLWLSWGLRPEAMIGYSIGEYVAACLAGVLTLEDALTLVVRRAQMIEELPAGAMLAVPLTPEALEPLLGGDLSLAAVNGPEQSVVAGPLEAVEALERELDGRGLSYRRLQAAHAFHSALLEPLSAPLAELVRTFTLRPPALPYLSNVTGTWITPEEATDPTYWARHMCGTVRFAEGIEELLRQPRRILLEVGPGQTLSSLVLQHPAASAGIAGDRPEVLASVRHSYEREDDQAYLLGALGKAWMAGARIDWASFYAGERRLRVPLPTYPFERQRYWVEPQQEASRSALSRQVLGGAAPALQEGSRLSSPSWKRSLPRALSARDLATPRRWLVLADGSGLSRGLVEKLRGAGHEVATATPGLDFRHDGNAFTVRPSSAADWGSLLAALPRLPEKVLHLWGLAADPGFAEAQELGLGALRGLSQALAGALSLADPVDIEEAPEICMILAGTQEVTGDEALRPDGATALAGCWLLPAPCRALDVVAPAGDGIPTRLVDQVLAEALGAGEDSERLVAYRGGHRWLPSLEPVQEEPGERCPPGTYLITGGLSPAGFFLARALAAEGVRLALIEPSGQAPEAAAARVEELRRAGAEVWSTEADLADPEIARRTVAAARERFGDFDGVLHAAWPEGEDGAFPSARWLLALDEAARDLSPSSALIVSPLTPLTPQAPLAEAAEAVFLETFAISGRGALPWVSVVWDTRQELAPEELSRVLRRLLGGLSSSAGLRQVVVAGRPLATRWEALAPGAETPASQPAGALASYSRPHLKVDYVAPRDETEQVIAGIWAELLGVGQVGVHDPFLDLGGDSLLATRLVARMRDAFGLELPVRLIFEAATVAEQAATLEGLRAQHEEGEMAELLALLDGLSEEEAALELERRKSLINAGG